MYYFLEKYKFMLPKDLKRSFLKQYFFKFFNFQVYTIFKIIPIFQDFSILYIDSLLFHC